MGGASGICRATTNSVQLFHELGIRSFETRIVRERLFVAVSPDRVEPLGGFSREVKNPSLKPQEEGVEVAREERLDQMVLKSRLLASFYIGAHSISAHCDTDRRPIAPHSTQKIPPIVIG